MPLILGTNSIKDTGYNVANSCRFNDGDSSYLSQSTSSSTGKIFTLSFWMKKSTDSSTGIIFIMSSDSVSHNYIEIATKSANGLDVQLKNGSGGTFLRRKLNRLFRDFSAWMHVCIRFDSTNGTAGNRLRIYVNGTQETDIDVDSTPDVPEDYVTDFNNSSTINIARNLNDSSYYDGYLAEMVLVDGSSLAPTSFGEFDEDSPTIWKPINVSGLTFGTNGFYLDFEDSANLGNDKNGGTDLTEVNLAATDSATDSPTNNFATWNPLAQTPQKGTTAEGNLEYDRAGGSDNWVTIASTIAATAGKWYYEYKIIDGGSSTGNGSLVGFLDYNTSAFQHTANDAITNAGEYAWYGASGNLYINGTDVAQVDSYTDDDIVMVAMDLDNSKAYWGKNGTWIDSGDPTSGATGTGARDIANVSSGTFAFAVSHREGGNGQANFGNPPFSISSGNADDNDYGNFEYDVPTGYLALCTKNLGSDGG